MYVSAGHGWNYSSGAWRTQRGNTFDLVEDMITVEIVNQHLIPYLHAMGAYVVPIRESDLNTRMLVIDDDDATIEGTVVEGAKRTGWGPIPSPFTGAQNPFALGSTRSMKSSAEETGRLAFATKVATSDYYNVYISYAQGADRVRDAHVIVNHAGGTSHLRVDQRRHGSTWVLKFRCSPSPTAGGTLDQTTTCVNNETLTHDAHGAHGCEQYRHSARQAIETTFSSGGGWLRMTSMAACSPVAQKLGSCKVRQHGVVDVFALHIGRTCSA